jgi:hypothetical protein
LRNFKAFLFRFSKDLKSMLGFNPGWYFKVRMNCDAIKSIKQYTSTKNIIQMLLLENCSIFKNMGFIHLPVFSTKFVFY